MIDYLDHPWVFVVWTLIAFCAWTFVVQVHRDERDAD